MSERAGAESALLAAHRFLRRGPVSEEGWSQLVAKGRDWELGFLLLAAVAVACLLVLMSFSRSGLQRAGRAQMHPSGPAVTHR